MKIAAIARGVVAFSKVIATQQTTSAPVAKPEAPFSLSLHAFSSSEDWRMYKVSELAHMTALHTTKARTAPQISRLHELNEAQKYLNMLQTHINFLRNNS